MRKYEKAIESGKRSVEFGPNIAMVNFLFGGMLNEAGRFDEGIAYLKRVNSFRPFSSLLLLLPSWPDLHAEGEL